MQFLFHFWTVGQYQDRGNIRKNLSANISLNVLCSVICFLRSLKYPNPNPGRLWQIMQKNVGLKVVKDCCFIYTYTRCTIKLAHNLYRLIRETFLLIWHANSLPSPPPPSWFPPWTVSPWRSRYFFKTSLHSAAFSLLNLNNKLGLGVPVGSTRKTGASWEASRG